jgi:photosystem II stability/assembly factor-like uncharacterized protein
MAAPCICVAGSGWSSLGPEGGEVSAMAIDPQNPAILYTAVSGRIFKTIDSGENWFPAENGITPYPYSGIYALAVNPKNASIIYAGTSGGIYRSTDGGESWSMVLYRVFVQALAIDPENPIIVYAGTSSQGVLKSNDSGSTWSPANNGLAAVKIASLAINPKSTSILYAGAQGTGRRIYKSVDGAATWNASGPEIEVFALAINPDNPAIVYAASFSSTPDRTGIYKTTTAGEVWAEIPGSPMDGGRYGPKALAIDSKMPDILYVSNYFEAYKSTNGGVSWTPFAPSSDIGFVVFCVNPQNSSIVYAGSAAWGVYRSTNGGTVWVPARSGLTGLSITGFALDPQNPATLYVASRSQLFKSVNGGFNWTKLGWSRLSIGHLAVDPQNPNTIYLASGGLYKSTDGGSTWNRVFVDPASELGLVAIAIYPEDSRILYIGTFEGKIYKSTDGGANWSAVSGPSDHLNDLVIDPRNAANLLAGTSGNGLFRSTDGGASWNSIDNGLGSKYIWDLVINPQNSSIVYASTEHNVFKSINGGVDWSAVSNGLAGVNVEVLAMNPETPKNLYAGTYTHGVFRSIDGGSNWTAMNEGFSNANIQFLAVDPVGRRIYAATPNRSMWVHALSSTTLDLNLSGGGVTAASTGGADMLRAGYAGVHVNSGSTPYGTAVFRLSQNGTVVSEAGVPASPPTRSARIFIDYRAQVDALPARGGSGKVDTNTGIAIVNYGLQQANVVFTLRDRYGNPLAVGNGKLNAENHVACFIDQLKNNAAPDFSLPVDFQSRIQFGSLEIAADQPISVLALRGTTNQRNEFLITTTPVADITHIPGNGPVYFPQFVDGGGYTTALILLNTSDVRETGRLEIRDKDGNPLAVNQAGGTTDSSFSYSIEPGGLFRFQTDGFPVDTKAGWVRLIPDAGTPTPVGSGVFGYNPNDVLVSESGIPAAAATTRARVYVDLSGNHNTGLAIANISNTGSNITINAFQNNGVTAAGTSKPPIPLSANGYTAGFADEFVTGLPADFTGVMDISSPVPFAALTLRSLDNERGDFLMATFPVADANQAAPSPLVFPHIADGGGYVTEIILISAGPSATTAVVFYDESGTPTDFGE